MEDLELSILGPKKPRLLQISFETLLLEADTSFTLKAS